MEALVDPKQTQEIGGDGVSRGASFPFPKGCVEVVASAEYRAFPHIHGLRGALELDEATCQLEIRIADGAPGVLSRGEAIPDPLRPGQAPQDGLGA